MRLSFLKRHNAIIESFFSLSILNGLNVLLPLITLPYILRVVGMANYGIYSYIYVLIQYLLLLNAYGFNYSATKQIAQERDNPASVNQIYNSIVKCRLILFIAGIIFFVLLSPVLLNTRDQVMMFLMGLGVVFGDIFSSVWLFQGMEKMRYMTIVNVISKSIFTVLIFIFITTAGDFKYIILLNSFGFLLTGLLSIIIARREFKIRFVTTTWDEMKYQFKDGFALFGSTIGMNLYRNANIFILNFFVNEAAVGIYATAEKVIKALQMITVPIAQALFPHMGYRFKAQSVQDNLKILFKVSKFFAIILSVEFILTLIFSPWIIRIIAGEHLGEAVLLVRIMSVVILVGGLNYVLGMVGLVNLNKQKIFFIAVMVSGIISIIFLLLTVKSIGIKSGAWALVISEIILLMLCLWNFKKINKSAG